jgi:MerR family transcriptional regulator, light-induced transcriptional regulator
MSLPFENNHNDDTPLFNIGMVTRITKITASTLRAWERRYNFPKVKHTAGGHRLYSEKDIFQLNWVKQRVDEGMQTGQAIRALVHQEQSGRLLINDDAVPASARPGKEHSYLPKFREKIMKCLVNMDISGADQILGEALVVATPDDLILDLITPVISQIGDGWEAGRISVAIEHLATNYLRQKLLMWMMSGPQPLPIAPITLACAPDEWHEGSLLAMGALLRRRRYPIAYLGQAVPLPDLAKFVREIKPSLVIVIAMTEETASLLTQWPQWLTEVAISGRPPIGYGGRIFTQSAEWRLKMTGTFLGNEIREGLAIVEKLMDQSMEK